MKPIFLFLLLSIAVSDSFAQSNVFPSYGKVGIGTLSPYYRLHVDSGYVFSSTGFITPEYYWIGNGSVGYIRKLNNNIPLHFANAGGVPELTIAGNGNVGIGENNPLHKLDVAGSIRSRAQYDNYTPDGLFSTNAQPSGITTPNGAMRIRFGYFDQGSNQYWGRIGFQANTNWSFGTASGGHSFSIGRDYYGEDFLIDNTGKVGIGTSTPSSNLHVYGTRSIATIEATPTGDHASVVIKAAGNNGGGAPSVYFNRGDNMYGALFVERGTDGGNQPIFAGSNTTDFVLGSTASVPLRFGINKEVKMSLDVSGKLGIGTNTPGSVLHIRRDSYGEQFRISAYGDGSDGNGLSIGIMGVIPAQYGAQTSYYTAINNGYAGDDNSLLVINNKGYNNGEKFADFAIGNGKGTPIMFVDGSEAKIGIGTVTPSEKLSVNGNIRAKKILVSQSGWPDYVFGETYRLRPLSELSAYIQQNKHLPEIPSASDVESKGISVGDNQALLLKKIEELTLYVLDLQKQIDQLKKNKQ